MSSQVYVCCRRFWYVLVYTDVAVCGQRGVGQDTERESVGVQLASVSILPQLYSFSGFVYRKDDINSIESFIGEYEVSSFFHPMLLE